MSAFKQNYHQEAVNYDDDLSIDVDVEFLSAAAITTTGESNNKQEEADATTTSNTNNKKSTIKDALALGGSVGILAGSTYIIGFVLFGVFLRDVFDNDKLGTVENVQFLEENQTVFFIANTVSYILNGFLQIILACTISIYLSSHGDGKTVGVFVNNITTAGIGCVWGGLVIAAGMIGNGGAKVAIDLLETEPEQAAALWMTIDVIYTNGIGGGNEIVGAVWIFAVSIMSFRNRSKRSFPIPVNLLGAIAGIAGCVTIVPVIPYAEEATAIFGITMVVWYILAGTWLLRDSCRKEK